MKINHSRVTARIAFASVPPNQPFMYGAEVFLRLDMHADSKWNAVSLNYGHLAEFKPNDSVRLVDAEVTIL